MLVLAILLAAASPAQAQILAGPAFEDLAKRTEAACPSRAVRAITPADLDFMQEGFEDTLSRRDRARLRSANAAGRRCAERNGLTCPTIATLEAMRKLRLTPRFAAYLCSHPNSTSG